MTQPVAVAIVTDTSESMSVVPHGEAIPKIGLVRTDASTFVSIMQWNGKAANALGQVGLVTFDTDSNTIFQMRQLDTDGAVRKAVHFALRRLVAKGASTNVKAGVTSGQAMASAVDPRFHRAVVLLSDAEWNIGGDPTQGLATNIPVYTIGFGKADQLTYLKVMASNTGGKYHNTPYPMVLSNIYSDIIGELNIASVILNTVHTVPSYAYKAETVAIPPETREASFACLWGHPDIEYTSTTPGMDQLAVLIHDPSGKQVEPSSIIAPAGGGHALLGLRSPTAGDYKLTAWFAGSSKSQGPQQLDVAFNLYLPPSDIRVSLKTDPRPKPLEVEAMSYDGSTPLPAASLDAEAFVLRPFTPEHDAGRQADETLARRPHPRQMVQEPIEVTPHPSGNGHLLRVRRLVPGASQQVYYRVRGNAPVGGEFERTSLLTITP